MKRQLSILVTFLIALNFATSCGTLQGIVKDVMAPISGELSVTSPHYSLLVDLLSCQAQGEYVYLEFTITNNGNSDLSRVQLTSNRQNVEAFDDMGNTHRFAFLRQGEYTSNDFLQLPRGVPVKITTRIYNVRQNAVKFSLIQFYVRHSGSPNIDGKIEFKNVPIFR
jgi:hypothetical protein